MRMIAALIFYFFYWGICFLATGSDRKNLIGLRSYPDDVQRCVRNDPQLPKLIPSPKSMTNILLSNLIMFTAAFSIFGLVLNSALGLEGFGDTFLYFLAFGEGLGLFDLVVIDLIWWRNTKRIRFSFLPGREHYQDPGKHIGSFVRGIPLFAAIAALTAAIVTAL